ncbi:hypothetical protein [Sphingomonas sp. URHD0057]|uniref:hypothetical protein n=1 Tax=Sphingomonas sp. URHD0057 TaxID=1380389 RepID=UPI000490CEB1|nr:hypothetical protein [Sphingomonas sp. URHD0057]
MANYQKLVRQQPMLREFIQNREWVHRGEALVYKPNVNCGAFSIDGAGFRHSTCNGARFSLADCQKSDRYGVVLGASNIYGFGVVGNENTLPSLLAERFGFPFANLGMPAGNSRNLYTLLMSLLPRSAQPPAAVVHFSGGDYSSFCRTSSSDPVFGSPGRLVFKAAVQEGQPFRDPDRHLPDLLAFSSLWIAAIVEACRAHNVPVVLGHDSTFFDKSSASAGETEFGLGKPVNKVQVRQFQNHRRFGDAFYGRRKEVADQLNVPLAGLALTNDMTFVDEFHCDAPGTRLLANAVGDALEPLLKANSATAALASAE